MFEPLLLLPARSILEYIYVPHLSILYSLFSIFYSLFSILTPVTVPLVPLTSLADFNRLLIRVILPCLIGRNRAILEWLTLAATVANLDELYDWTSALRYVDGIIGPQMRLRAPFGESNSRLQQSIQAAFVAASLQKQARSSTAAAPRGQAASAPRRAPAQQACHPWNFAREGCHVVGCPSPHVCAYTFKAGKDGRKCPADDNSDHNGYHCSVHVHPPRASSRPPKPSTTTAAARPAPLTVIKSERSGRAGVAAAAKAE